MRSRETLLQSALSKTTLSNVNLSHIRPPLSGFAIALIASLSSIAFQLQATSQQQSAILGSSQQSENKSINEDASNLLEISPELSIEIASYKKAEVNKRLPLKYPRGALRQGLEGFVRFSFAVAKNGEVKDVEVIDSSGMREFEQEGLVALKRWEYHPATLNGMPVESSNYTVQLDFILDNKKVGIRKRFKMRLDAANESLRGNDLIETKRLIDELDDRKQYNNMEVFLFAMLEADYAKISNNLLMEEHAFAAVYHHLMRESSDEKYRSYAIQRMFILLVDAKRYVAAKRVYEKALKTSKDDLLLSKIKGVVDQIDTLIDAGKPIKRKGVIRGRQLWNHGLVYNQFSIVDVSGDIDELQIRCDLKVTVYDFKPNNTWSIPANWGKCSVLLDGEKGTTLSLIETNI